MFWITCHSSIVSHGESIGRDQRLRERFTDRIHGEIIDGITRGEIQIVKRHRGICSHIGVGHHIVSRFIKAPVCSNGNCVVGHLLTSVLSRYLTLVYLKSWVTYI